MTKLKYQINWHSFLDLTFPPLSDLFEFWILIFGFLPV